MFLGVQVGVAPLHPELAVVGDGLGDDVVKLREAHFAKIVKGATGVEENGRGIVGTERPDVRLRIVVELHRPDHRVIQILDRYVASRGKVISAGAGAVDCFEHSAGKVVDKDKITPRLGDEATLSL